MGVNAYSYRSVVYHRDKALGRGRSGIGKSPGRHRREVVSKKILGLRATGTRLSAKKTAALISEPRETTRRHFGYLDACYYYYPVRKVPHTLSQRQKEDRIRIAGEMLFSAEKQEELEEDHHWR